MASAVAQGGLISGALHYLYWGRYEGRPLNDTSGYEQIYEPYRWNDSGDIQAFTNCYAYALNLQENPLTGNKFLKRGEGGLRVSQVKLPGKATI